MRTLDIYNNHTQTNATAQSIDCVMATSCKLPTSRAHLSLSLFIVLLLSVDPATARRHPRVSLPSQQSASSSFPTAASPPAKSALTPPASGNLSAPTSPSTLAPPASGNLSTSLPRPSPVSTSTTSPLVPPASSNLSTPLPPPSPVSTSTPSPLAPPASGILSTPLLHPSPASTGPSPLAPPASGNLSAPLPPPSSVSTSSPSPLVPPASGNLSTPLPPPSSVPSPLAPPAYNNRSAPSASPSRPDLGKLPWTAQNLTLLGDASLQQQSVSLTAVNSTGALGVGRVFFSRPIRFREPGSGDPASFVTRFTFSITPSPTFGDGLAFFITSQPERLGASGGYMGLFPENGSQSCHNEADKSSHRKQPKKASKSCSKHGRLGKKAEIDTIAVEFDTQLDTALGDHDGNHVALDVGRMNHMVWANAMDAGVSFKEANKNVTAWIKYNSWKKKLTVWVSYSEVVLPERPVLAKNFDIGKYLSEFMHVGFSASNGAGGSALHVVHNWKFRTFGYEVGAWESSRGEKSHKSKVH